MLESLVYYLSFVLFVVNEVVDFQLPVIGGVVKVWIVRKSHRYTLALMVTP